MFPESRMRQIRTSGLMRGGSWPTLFGQLLPTLPYRFQGRQFRLTDVHGKVVKGVLA